MLRYRCDGASALASRTNAAFLGGMSLRSLRPSVLGPEAACLQGKLRLGRPSVDSLRSLENGALTKD